VKPKALNFPDAPTPEEIIDHKWEIADKPRHADFITSSDTSSGRWRWNSDDNECPTPETALYKLIPYLPDQTNAGFKRVSASGTANVKVGEVVTEYLSTELSSVTDFTLTNKGYWPVVDFWRYSP